MNQRRRFAWTLAAVLALLSAMAAAANQDPVVGRTGWDVFYSLWNSAPTIVMAIGVTAWGVAKVATTFIGFVQPERVRMRELWDREAELERKLHAYENRAGYLLLLVRELEAALEACTRTCPDCKGAVDKAVGIARQKALARGLILSDHTIPRPAEAGA